MNKLIFLIPLLLIACSRPDPHPELRDPIFNDLKSSLASTNQQLESEKKTLLEHEQALKEVVPQTGQIKYAQKRVNDSKNLIVNLEQTAQFLELKIQARQKLAQKLYLIAFKKGEDWPDPREWKEYSAEKRLRESKRTWDVESRVKEAEIFNSRTEN